MSYNIPMHLVEIPGLTASQKQVLVDDFGAPPLSKGVSFNDDVPTHTVGLQGAGETRLDEKRAALSSILVYNHLHPEGEILRKVGGVMTKLLTTSHTRSGNEVILQPAGSRGNPDGQNDVLKGDDAVIATMHWAAHHFKQVSSLTLSDIAEHDDEAARLAAFIGDEADFTASLEVVESCVASMEASGVLDEIDPKRVHDLPLPEPRMVYRHLGSSSYHLMGRA